MIWRKNIPQIGWKSNRIAGKMYQQDGKNHFKAMLDNKISASVYQTPLGSPLLLYIKCVYSYAFVDGAPQQNITQQVDK